MNGIWFLFGVLTMIPVVLIILASGRPQQPPSASPAAMPVVVTSTAKYTGDTGVGRAAFTPVVGSRYNVIDRFAYIEVSE